MSRYRGPKRERRALNAWVKLARAAESVGRALAARPLEGLTHPHLPVLEALHHVGPMSQVELGRKLLRSPSNITALLDVLEARGHVKRTRRTDDRRVVEVSITEAGGALVEAAFPAHAANVAEVLGALTPEEQEELARLCKKLGTSLDGPSTERSSTEPEGVSDV